MTPGAAATFTMLFVINANAFVYFLFSWCYRAGRTK